MELLQSVNEFLLPLYNGELILFDAVFCYSAVGADRTRLREKRRGHVGAVSSGSGIRAQAGTRGIMITHDQSCREWKMEPK